VHRISQALLGGPSTSPLDASRTPLDTSSLLWGLLFGSIGLGFFVYGTRQKMVVPLERREVAAPRDLTYRLTGRPHSWTCCP
jgi:hypothetical protein